MRPCLLFAFGCVPRIPLSRKKAVVRKEYASRERNANHKFEAVRGPELLVRVPLPRAEVWAEVQAQVEELLRAILENACYHLGESGFVSSPPVFPGGAAGLTEEAPVVASSEGLYFGALTYP